MIGKRKCPLWVSSGNPDKYDLCLLNGEQIITVYADF